MKNTVNGVLWLPQSPLQIKGLWKSVSCPVPKKEKLNNKGLSTCSWEDKALMNETLSYSLVCDQSMQFPRFTENILISKKCSDSRSFKILWLNPILCSTCFYTMFSFSRAAITTNYKQCHKNITLKQISWLCQVQERTAGQRRQQLLLALFQSSFRLVVFSSVDSQDFTFSQIVMPSLHLRGPDSQSTGTNEGIYIDFNRSSKELLIFHIFCFYTVSDSSAMCQPEWKP